MRDTPRPVMDVYRAMVLKLSPGERVVMACRMFTTAKELARTGIRQSQPSIGSSSAMRRELFLRLYQEDFPRHERAKILTKITEVPASTT